MRLLASSFDVKFIQNIIGKSRPGEAEAFPVLPSHTAQA